MIKLTNTQIYPESKGNRLFICGYSNGYAKKIPEMDAAKFVTKWGKETIKPGEKLKLTITKVLTSIALFRGCFLPVIMDLGSSHLLMNYRTLMLEHIWFGQFLHFLIFILGMYYLWIKMTNSLCLMSLCVLFGYSISAVSISFYVGVFLEVS